MRVCGGARLAYCVMTTCMHVCTREQWVGAVSNEVTPPSPILDLFIPDASSLFLNREVMDAKKDKAETERL